MCKPVDHLEHLTALELYNITEDPAEKHNRVADFPERANELKARLLA